MHKNLLTAIRDKNCIYRNIKLTYPVISGSAKNIAIVKSNELIRNYSFQFIRLNIPEYDIAESGCCHYKINIANEKIISTSYLLQARFSELKKIYTSMGSINIFFEDGSILKQDVLFIKGSNYLNLINETIEGEILKKKLLLIRDFKGLDSEFNFYIKPGYLVVYFQLYEYTPYIYGIPQFYISLEKLRDVINPEIYNWVI